MAYIIGALLALLSLIIISYPFLNPRLQSQVISRSYELEELAKARQSLFDELDRIKLDLDVDNITKKEYEELIGSVRRSAAESFRDEELLRSQTSPDEAMTLEELDNELEEKIKRLRLSHQRKNHACNCLECGRQLTLKDVACPGCGREVLSDDSPRHKTIDEHE